MSTDATFSQRVLAYGEWWRSGGPILFYLGGEGPIEMFYNYTGAIFEHAEALGALVVFVEHRFYGQSLPHGTNDANSPSDLRGLTVDQAMADYAWFIRGLRENLECGESECPIVTLGGSYGGMLVAWFRQKYPQLTAGGVAAGAPIDFYPHDARQAAFWNATRHTFEAYGSPGCPALLETALGALQREAASRAGRARLEVELASCDPLEDEETAGAKIEFFHRGAAAMLATLDYSEPSSFVATLPANPVAAACRRLQEAPDPIVGARAMADLLLNGTGGFRCYDYLAEVVGRPTEGRYLGPAVPPEMGPWEYQVCNELILEPLTTDGVGFYPPADDQIGEVIATCQLRYGITPRPDWLPLSLGRSDLRIGNLIFTNGEKDPWRTGAPKMSKVPPGLDISLHVIIGAAHHEDLRFDGAVPKAGVQEAKRLTREAMRRWIAKFQSPPVSV